MAVEPVGECVPVAGTVADVVAAGGAGVVPVVYRSAAAPIGCPLGIVGADILWHAYLFTFSPFQNYVLMLLKH